MAASLLLVHAGTDDRAMYAEYLRAHGFSVAEAGTTDAALSQIEAADAVITGLLVPGSFDAVTLIEHIRTRSHRRMTPIVVVTACVVAEIRERAQRAGCDVLLTKPCLPDSLLAEVRRLLESSTAR